LGFGTTAYEQSRNGVERAENCVSKSGETSFEWARLKMIRESVKQEVVEWRANTSKTVTQTMCASTSVAKDLRQLATISVSVEYMCLVGAFVLQS